MATISVAIIVSCLASDWCREAVWEVMQRGHADAVAFASDLGQTIWYAHSQEAKRRLAKELGGVPRSASPTAQGRTRHGTKWWEYTDSQGNRKIVVEHADGSVHVGTPKPQSEHQTGGEPKYRAVPGTGHVGED